MEHEHDDEWGEVEFLFDAPLSDDVPEWMKEKVEITFQVAEFGYLLNLLFEHHEGLRKRSEMEPDSQEVIMGGLTTEIVRNRLMKVWQTKYGALQEEVVAQAFANEAQEWLSQQ